MENNKKKDIFKKRVNYKPFEYPEVMDLVKVINQTYWKVDEVDFTADVQDFKSNLTDLEKEIFKRNLLAISQVEVGVKTFWGKLYDYFPKPEFNNMGATFAENEVTHSEAYSKLLEVLGYNNEFEKLLEIPIFKKKIDLIEESLTNRKDILERLMFFTIVIENASLFSQFANILSFTRFKGIMKNTANIINWSSSDEQCFLPDTEVMTPNGWVKIQDFKIGDEVFGYKEGKIQLEKVLKTTKNTSDTIIKLGSKYNYTYLTPNHDVILYDKNKGKWYKTLAKNHPKNGHNGYPINGNYISDNDNSLTVFERILIALQADGTKSFWTNKDKVKLNRGKNGGFNCSISLYKQRKIDRFRELLKQSDIRFSERPIKNYVDKMEGVIFRLHIDSNINIKSFDWVDLKEVSRKWCEEFIDEVLFWDGNVNKTYKCYCSTNKECIDKVNIIAILAGYNTNIYENKDSLRKVTNNNCYKISFKDKDKVISTTTAINKEYQPYNGNVYCITVPSGGLITRYENKIFITGNCHAEGGIYIINTIKKENPDYFKEMSSHIIEDVHRYIQYEKELLDWIFEKGELEFYTKNDLWNFMKYRVDLALERMGFEKQFNITEEEHKPMRWYDEETKMQALPDFFAIRPVEYTKHNQPYTKDNLF